MRALYFDGKRLDYREDYEMPTITPGHSLIRVLVSAICNTDREVMRGYRPDFKGVLGHEFVGIVEDSDKLELIGKRVVGELNEGCGDCIYCNSGREKHCVTRKVIGMEGLDGSFADYLVLANHLIHTVPDTLPTEKAIYVEPLAAALEIPNRFHFCPETSVAIIGDGRLAFMIAQVISLYGVELTIIGKHPEKLELFRPHGKIVHQDGDTYEVVIDATGSPSGMELARRIVRKQGTIIMKSTYAGTVEMDLSYFVVNEITIKGSRCGPFEPALNLLNRGLIHLPEIELYDLSEHEAAFASRAFKTGFRMEG